MRTLVVFAFAAVVLLLIGLSGCSSGPETRTVTGQLDTTQLRLVNAQVFAMASDGRAFRAAIAANGAFSIAVPVGSTYSLRFANATSLANRYDTFAVLASARADGTRTRWYTVTSGPSISLGRVGFGAGGTATSTSGLSTLSDDEHEDGSSDEADDGDHEDDEAEVCDVSQGHDEADVESDHDLLDDVDSDHDGKADSIDDDDDRGTCAAAGDDDCKLDDDEAHELDDDHEAPCASGTTGGTTGGGVAASPGVL